MAQTNTHLHFTKTCEEAFNFYKSAFGTEFIGEIVRMGDVPTMEGQPPLSADDKQLVMYVQLPILGGHVLVGNDRHPCRRRPALYRALRGRQSGVPDGRDVWGQLFRCVCR